MKKIISCLLIIAIFLSLFTMVTFAGSLSPNVVANYHFTTSTHGWSVFGTTSSIIYQNGYVGTNTYGKSWISPAKNIYDVIKTEGAGTYVINARIYIDYDSVDKVQARMMMRGDRAYSFFPDHYGENRGGIGVLTYFEPRTWTNISGSIKVLESDIDYDTGEFTLCFDCFDDSAPYNVYIDNVTICKLYEDDVTNGDFSWNEIGWRNWGGDGNFTIEYRYESQFMNYFFQAYYLKASTYGSIVTNVDQIIAKYGCTKYKLSFKIKVEEDYLENLDKIRFFLARDNGDYNYWIGAANATALEDGKWLTVEKTIDMATMITNEQTLYDKLAPYRDEVFLRFDYVDAAGSTYDEEHSYYITDVSFTVAPEVTRVILEQTWKNVEIGWSGFIGYRVEGEGNLSGVHWYSTNPDVATVDSNTGRVKVHDTGATFIFAKSKDDPNVYASCVIKSTSSDPFHYSNIDYIRIKKYDQSDMGGDSEITTIVIKSKLNNNQYFECYAPDRAQVAFEISPALISGLNSYISRYQQFPLIGTDEQHVYGAKLVVDEMVRLGKIESQSAEYYGVWVTVARSLILDSQQFLSAINVVTALAGAAYSVYNVVTTIQSINLQSNNSITLQNSTYTTMAQNTDDLFDELSAKNVSYSKEKTMWIVRKPDGKICWMETGKLGDKASGFAHIVDEHYTDFSGAFGINSKSDISKMIYTVVATQNPNNIIGDEYIYLINGRSLSVIIGNNGYIVTAYPSN